MEFSPSGIWSWYKRRPTWLKVILFVVIILAVVASAAIVVFAGRKAMGEGPDPVKVAKDELEEHFWNEYRDATEKDKELAADIEAGKAERVEREKERQDAAKDSAEDHRDIDAASDFDDIDDVLRRRRE